MAGVGARLRDGLTKARSTSAAILYATRLITSGADPTDVQNALRHSSLRITLETYVHWWPKKDRRRNIISGALREASAKRKRGPKAPNSR